MSTTTKLPTQDEIAARIAERTSSDVFGFECGEYLAYLDFDHAKRFLKPDATREEWGKDLPTLSREGILAQMEKYMEFAWDKANNGRGISANRSIKHYIAWTWLAGDSEVSAEIERRFADEYQFYGKDILVRICEIYGWDPKKWDNGIREN